MKPRVYIAGKVTGEHPEACAVKFAKAEQLIQAHGFETVNPLAVVNDWNATWSSAMRKCISALMQCDHIYLLPCVAHSPGARIEKQLAEQLGITPLEL